MRGRPLLELTVALAAAAALLAGCGSSAGEIDPSGVDELVIPTPSPDAEDFVEGIDNPWLPLTSGNRWVYRVTTEDGVQERVVTVAEETREVAGIAATVVRDELRDEGGDLVTESSAWYAEDRDGNVWFLGEDVTTYDGKRRSSDGSWEAGVDGAQAGLAMAAVPRVGDGYLQGLLPGVVEDRTRVVSLEAAVVTPAGSYEDALETEDTTPLAPGVVVRRAFARGVGLVAERDVAGGTGLVELVAFTPVG